MSYDIPMMGGSLHVLTERVESDEYAPLKLLVPDRDRGGYRLHARPEPAELRVEPKRPLGFGGCRVQA